MEQNRNASPPRSLSFLPAIFHAGASWMPADDPSGPEASEGVVAHDDALAALLSAWELLLGSVNTKIDRLEHYFDPWTAPAAPILSQRGVEDEGGYRQERPTSLLEWLGQWVAVDLEEVDTSASGGERERHLERRRRRLVSEASQLWKRRGTPAGLRDLLRAFYEVDVEVREWMAPQGMRIEVSSVVGVDTALMPDHDLQQSFVVVWTPPPELRANIQAWRLEARREGGEPEAWMSASVIRAQQQLRHGTAVPAAQRSHAGGWDASQQRWVGEPPARWVDDPRWEASRNLRTKAQRIRALIDRERPAHTHCYLALAWGEEASQGLDPLRIEVTSTIGMTLIEPDQRG